MARQGPRKNDSRSRSRNRGRPTHRRDRSASRQPPTHRRQEPLELPRTWRSSPTEYDTNREYGLNLPRQVVSNKFTRDLQIDGMDIFDIRLAQVMTGGLTNWGLRSLANGRHTFKSRQEAINYHRDLDASFERRELDSLQRCRSQFYLDSHDQKHVSRAGPIPVGQPVHGHQGISQGAR